MRCEPPNSRLYHFTGNLEMPSPLSVEPMVVPAPPAAVLLRGCSLRNTSRIYGLVIYAGAPRRLGSAGVHFSDRVGSAGPTGVMGAVPAPSPPNHLRSPLPTP